KPGEDGAAEQRRKGCPCHVFLPLTPWASPPRSGIRIARNDDGRTASGSSGPAPADGTPRRRRAIHFSIYRNVGIPEAVVCDTPGPSLARQPGGLASVHGPCRAARFVRPRPFMTTLLRDRPRKAWLALLGN